MWDESSARGVCAVLHVCMCACVVSVVGVVGIGSRRAGAVRDAACEALSLHAAAAVTQKSHDTNPKIRDFKQQSRERVN